MSRRHREPERGKAPGRKEAAGAKKPVRPISVNQKKWPERLHAADSLVSRDLTSSGLSIKLEDYLGDTIKLEDLEDSVSILNTVQDEPPRKKPRRILMDAVEITRPPWMKSELQRIKEELEIREKEFLNPKWKIKRNKEDVAAGLSSVFHRIEALNVKPFPLNLDEDLLNSTVSREFVSFMYGGNAQETFPRISQKNYERHGYNDFMYLNITYNPRAPQRAGFPGLFYRARISDLAQFHRVFIRIEGKAWLYIGQYELIRADPLTQEEWLQNSHDMKTIWSTKMCQHEWGKNIRARIALRKRLHREPTAEEIESTLGDDRRGVTPEQVMDAYNKGEELMSVWVMKCVAYDEGFQREMVEKFKTWKPKEKTPAKGPKKPGNRKRRAQKGPGTNHDSNENENTHSPQKIVSGKYPRVRQKPKRYLP